MVRLILCSPIPVKRRRASATMLGCHMHELRRFWIDRWRAKATIGYNWESYHEGKRSSTEASRCRRLLERLSAGDWTTSINVRDFIVRNVTPYPGNEDFLTGPSQRTTAVWAKLQPYFADERKKGVLAVDAQNPSTLLAHPAGYIDRDNEVIVGLQTDQPFKRGIFPSGGLRMVEAGLKAGGFPADPQVHEALTT